MRSHLSALVRFVVVVSAFLFSASAQQNANLEQGLKPYGTYQGGNLDSVSITNRNLTLHIPIVSYPQRGGKLRLNFLGIYNNKGWIIEEYNDTYGNPHLRWKWIGTGVQIINDQSIGVKSTIIKVTNAQGDLVMVNLKDAITADGSSHQLESANSGMESVDATGILYGFGSGVIDRDGTRYGGRTNAIEDSNGNKITINTATGWTDTLGRFISGSVPGTSFGNNLLTGSMVPGVTTTDYSNCPTGTVAARLWNLPGPNGGTSPIKLCYASYTLQSSFGVSGISDTSVTDRFLRAIVQPNLTSWLFQYNSWGDLTQVTLPTGGTISYAWSTQGLCNTGGLQFLSRGVTSRTLDANDGTGPKTWAYSGSTVTDPLGNDTVHVVTDLDGMCSLYVTETRSYQGSSTLGTLLKTASTSYSWLTNPRGRLTPDSAPAINVVATSTTITWPNGKKSQSTATYDSGNTFSFYDIDYSQWVNYPLVYGSVMQTTESDYGNPNPGPVLRQTVNTYLWTSDANYKSRNMLNLVSSSTVKDGAGTQIAQTTITYDEATVNGQTNPAASGITMQHNVPPSGGTYRGNPTTSCRWLNTTGLCVNSFAVFYDTGTVYKSFDPGNHMTTFTYLSSFYGAYVTQTQFPDTNSPNLAHHIISGNYDFNSGLLTSFTDENGNSSTYAYDNMWRITSAVFPPQNGLNGQTNFYYPDVLTVERQQKIDSTRWTDLFVRFDGLGREIRRITANDESTPWDQADTCYNNRGEKSFGSYPYQGAGLSAPQVCTGAGDSFTYDALGRVTRVTHSDGTYVQSDYTGPATQVTDEGNGTRGVQRISQADGLGRLTNVCEVTSTTLIGITPTPSACGLDIAATGFLTSYSYAYDPTSKNLTFSVQQGGLNARTAVYDSFSRLTSSTNPEAGTISYGYNSDSLLTSRVAPAPNQTGTATVTTNYTYDELHRPRTRTYVNDTTGTPAATFNYDEASAFGVTLSNSLGRQSSLFVVNGQSQTLSAEVFSYDSMGRVLNNSQCTPQNCPSATFPVSYTYDLIGDALTGTNGLGVTLTYAYNRAARLTTLISSLSDTNHPGTLVSAVHYNAFGGQTTASLGSGVSESLGYTARGWLQSVGATLGGNGVYSFSLTFAGNGNVLTGNDSVNGNWTYGYDDFNRLASASKTGAAYTYDYDRFGNRWHQNGPNSSSLGFDANNRITGSGVTYDAAGNVTYDGQNSYTYDAENRIISTSGPNGTGTYVYSAAGMRIRKTTASGTVDYLYDLTGHAVTEVNLSGAWTR
ncbi:MAG: RHS repeat protein, partial [Acidobacteria bacterium]|nr:RHS repeat protein [Acidobacteriota bacterium]